MVGDEAFITDGHTEVLGVHRPFGMSLGSRDKEAEEEEEVMFGPRSLLAPALSSGSPISSQYCTPREELLSTQSSCLVP